MENAELRELAARRTQHEQHMDWVLEHNPLSYRHELDSEWISTSPGSPGYENEEDRAILRAREELEALERRER